MFYLRNSNDFYWSSEDIPGWYFPFCFFFSKPCSKDQLKPSINNSLRSWYESKMELLMDSPVILWINLSHFYPLLKMHHYVSLSLSYTLFPSSLTYSVSLTLSFSVFLSVSCCLFCSLFLSISVISISLSVCLSLTLSIYQFLSLPLPSSLLHLFYHSVYDCLSPSL